MEPLYLNFNTINGYIEDNNEIKYLTSITDAENKGAIKRYKKHGIKLSILLSQRIMTHAIIAMNT